MSARGRPSKRDVVSDFEAALIREHYKLARRYFQYQRLKQRRLRGEGTHVYSYVTVDAVIDRIIEERLASPTAKQFSRRAIYRCIERFRKNQAGQEPITAKNSHDNS